MDEWKAKGVADDDQSLMYQVWVDNKDMFEYFYTNGNFWAMYKDFLNMKAC